MKFIGVPKILTISDIENKKSLSPFSYRDFTIKNSNFRFLKDLVNPELLKKGEEVGSASYIYQSNYFFIRNKALQENHILPILNNIESCIPILPNRFIQMNLKEGDILVSKDANVGEVGYINKDLNNYMTSGGIYRIRIPFKIRYYVLAFLKNRFFKEQIYNMAPRGATIKHAKKLWLDVKIPFPTQPNQDEVIKYISLLTKSAIEREFEIRRKFNKIISLINAELKENQKDSFFNYNYPTIMELENSYRIDAGFYGKDLLKEQFLIENYKHGYQAFSSTGFCFKRGQNLQVSQIGRSIYSDKEKNNFYKLIRPLNLTDYGTVEKYEYLGNSKDLQTINRGEIIFSAEGSIGKFHVFVDADKKTITNIHGITIYSKEQEDDVDSIFMGSFLSYLRVKGVLDFLSVGGQGGSLAQKYWKYLKFPIFPYSKKEEIANLYHNSVNTKEYKLNINNFEQYDKTALESSGILQLDKKMKEIKGKMDECVHKIAMDKKVIIDFDFLNV